MKREVLLATPARRRLQAGDAERALADARRIADYLKNTYGARVFGIGSLFERGRRFTPRSDIDLVVRGLPDGVYFKASVEASRLSGFRLDLIPWEDANALVREIVAEAGKEL